MYLRYSMLKRFFSAASILVIASSCGFKHKKYENPITKDTQQPDKVLFDKSIKDIEHGRFEVARLTLNTLINGRSDLPGPLCHVSPGYDGVAQRAW